MNKQITFETGKACIDCVPLDNDNFIFVSQGCWYEKDSICWLEGNCGSCGGWFVGNHVIDDETEAKNRRAKIGDVAFLDGELCGWAEFDIYDKNRNLLVKATR